MENKIKSFIDSEKLINENDTIVLGLSGGIDSMVLFSVLKNLGYKLVIAHVNHHVRKESDEELIFTKEYVSSYGIPYESIVLDKIENNNFQDEARKLRYQFFYDVAKKYGTNIIATAHHQDDLLETVIMRISRGSNLYGYGGIKSKVSYNGFTIIRPLLCVNKEEIKQYQIKNSLPYREDASNNKDSYTRNRIRHSVIPNLVLENEKTYENVFHYSKQIYQAFSYIRKNTISLYQKNKGKIDNSSFAKLDEALQFDFLSYILEEKKIDCSYNKLNLMRKLILSEKPNGEITLNENCVFQKTYETSTISMKKSCEDYEFFVYENDCVTLPNGAIVKITRNLENNKDIFLKVCYNNIRFPLMIRNRRNGDSFDFPFGKKKIKKLFIDMKIPLDERDSVPIVLNHDGEILGIPGIIKGPANVDEPLYIVYLKEESNYAK